MNQVLHRTAKTLPLSAEALGAPTFLLSEGPYEEVHQMQRSVTWPGPVLFSLWRSAAREYRGVSGFSSASDAIHMVARWRRTGERGIRALAP